MNLLSQLSPLLLPVAQAYDANTGSNITAMLVQTLGIQMPTPQISGNGTTEVNSLGKAVQSASNNTSTKAQERATNVAKPR
jgi:hypothetical protein